MLKLMFKKRSLPIVSTKTGGNISLDFFLLKVTVPLSFSLSSSNLCPYQHVIEF